MGVHVIGCFGVLWSFVFCFISGAEEGHARLPLQTPREKDFRMRPTGQPHANYVHDGTVADIHIFSYVLKVLSSEGINPTGGKVENEHSV